MNEREDNIVLILGIVTSVLSVLISLCLIPFMKENIEHLFILIAPLIMLIFGIIMIWAYYSNT